MLPLVVEGGMLCGDDYVNANKGRADLQGGVERAVTDCLPGHTVQDNIWSWIKPITLITAITTPIATPTPT